jgi:hypothetical protein
VLNRLIRAAAIRMAATAAPKNEQRSLAAPDPRAGKRNASPGNRRPNPPWPDAGSIRLVVFH